MLYAYYRETHLEQWMNTKYLNHGISSPADLDIDRIAEAFGIGLVYGNHPSFSDNEENVIFLNKMMKSDQARVVFFHELCHVLRHAGDQRRMTELFMHAQETEAEQFVLYAAIPFFMFAKLPVPDHRSEAVVYIAEQFQVPLELAEQRLDQIQRRVLQGSLIAAAQEATRRQREAEQNWSPETRRVLSQLERQIGGRGGR
ncbi:ImmA/IrrE family metallo-endopeptidase [Paenibacillus phoenicis]|uniref:ImmA/IrrE family metallo-endopeptidase n=1 Tax=Paenibacillus phoenicis TaxID=554117 RepID=A0ABU5PKN0_9BACL|nr:ImmA/IrrE family metallo-endopeptidase [Paenibacillus phoenicis]MEA3570478.1 ImmA/IrrE family metallo-endopeptidase [Paenibacillus phoenicis]